MCTGAVPVCAQLIYEALPKGTVHFGHAIKHLSQDEDGVLLQFAEQPDARADYVVAADGYGLTSFSARGCCFCLCTCPWTTPLTGTVERLHVSYTNVLLQVLLSSAGVGLG